MAAGKIPSKFNINVLKEEGSKSYKKPKKQSTKGLKFYTDIMESRSETLLASFYRADGTNVASLDVDKITISTKTLSDAEVEKIKALFPKKYDSSRQLFELAIPEKENCIKVNSHQGGFEVEVEGEDGLKYKCMIDPLGLTLDVTKADGIQERVANTRPEIEEFVKLAENNLEQAQSQVLLCSFTPALFECMLDPKEKRLKTPRAISDINANILDMYVQHKIQMGELRPDENGAYQIPATEGSKFSFMAISAPLAAGKTEQQYIYFAKKDDKTYILKEKFNEIKEMRFTKTGTGSRTKPHMTFTTQNSGGKMTSISIAVPLDEEREPDRSYIAQVSHFVGNKLKVTRGSGSGMLSDWPSESANIHDYKGGDISSDYTLNLVSPKDQADQPRREQEVPQTQPPQPPNGSGSNIHASNGGLRTNPYVPQPQKAVKKTVKSKINGDWFSYGGGALGLFMMAMLLIPGVGQILFVAGLAVFAGSQVIANLSYAFENPYTDVVTKYVNAISKANSKAETEAQKFWEIETQRGNEYDRFVALRNQLVEGDLSTSPGLALIASMFECTPENKFNLEYFLGAKSSEYQMRFLHDLREIYALGQATDEASLDAQKKAQEHFCEKYGVKNVFDSFDEVFFDKDNNEVHVSAHDALAESLQILGEIVSQKAKVEGLTQQVDDMLADCSSKGIERILAQPKADLVRLFDENVHGFARLFISGRLPVSEMERICSMISKDPAVIERQKNAIEYELHEITTGADSANMQGRNLKSINEKYASAQKILSGIEKILAAPLNADRHGAFDESKLRTFDQVAQDTQNMLWAIAYEDARKNQATNTCQPYQLDSLKQLYPSAPTDLYGQISEDDLSDAFKKVIEARAALFKNAKFNEILARNAILAGDKNQLVLNTAMADPGLDSLAHVLTSCRNDLEAKETLSAEEEQLKGLLETSSFIVEARQMESAKITEKLLSHAAKTLGTTIHAHEKPEDVEMKIAELDGKYPYFRSLPQEQKEHLASFVTGAPKAIQIKVSNKHRLPSNPTAEQAQQYNAIMDAAIAEFNSAAEDLLSGRMQAAVVASLEEKMIRESHGEADIPTRRQARKTLLEMSHMLDRFGIQADDNRLKILQAACEIAGKGNSLKRENLVAAILQTNSDLTLSTYDENEDMILPMQFGDLVGDKLSESDIKKLKNDLELKRKARENGQRKVVEQIGKRIGKANAEYNFNIGLGTKQAKNDKPAKQSRREKKHAKATENAQQFVEKTEHLVKSLQSTSKLVKDKVKTESQREQVSKDLEEQLKSVLGKNVDAFFKSKFGNNKNWDEIKAKIKNGKFSEADFKALIEQAKKFLQKKDRKIAGRMKKARRKNKDAKKTGALSTLQMERNRDKAATATERALEKCNIYQNQSDFAKDLASKSMKEISPTASYKYEKN